MSPVFILPRGRDGARPDSRERSWAAGVLRAISISELPLRVDWRRRSPRLAGLPFATAAPRWRGRPGPIRNSSANGSCWRAGRS
jgi:hypothetical protein